MILTNKYFSKSGKEAGGRLALMRSARKRVQEDVTGVEGTLY